MSGHEFSDQFQFGSQNQLFVTDRGNPELVSGSQSANGRFSRANPSPGPIMLGCIWGRARTKFVKL